MAVIQVKKNKVISKSEDIIFTKEFIGENKLKSVIKELRSTLEYFHDSSEETMRAYLRIDFSEYTQEEYLELYAAYNNTINTILRVDKDIISDINDLINEIFYDKDLFEIEIHEYKRMDKYFIKRINIPYLKAELDYIQTNLIQ